MSSAVIDLGDLGAFKGLESAILDKDEFFDEFNNVAVFDGNDSDDDGSGSTSLNSTGPDGGTPSGQTVGSLVSPQMTFGGADVDPLDMAEFDFSFKKTNKKLDTHTDDDDDNMHMDSASMTNRTRSNSVLSAGSVFSALRGRGVSFDLFPDEKGNENQRPRGLSLEFSMLPTSMSMVEIGENDRVNSKIEEEGPEAGDLDEAACHQVDDEEGRIDGDRGKVRVKNEYGLNPASARSNPKPVYRPNSLNRAFAGKRPRSVFVIQNPNAPKARVYKYKNTPAKATLTDGRKVQVYLRLSAGTDSTYASRLNNAKIKQEFETADQKTCYEKPKILSGYNSSRPKPTAVGNKTMPKTLNGTKPGYAHNNRTGLSSLHTINKYTPPQITMKPSSSSMAAISASASNSVGCHKTPASTSTGSTFGAYGGHSGMGLGLGAPPIGSDKNSKGKSRMIGGYTLQQRRERITRFLEKRKNRVWMKKVKYGCRKKLADSRPRVKGRFVPRTVQNPGPDGPGSVQKKLPNMGKHTLSGVGAKRAYGTGTGMMMSRAPVGRTMAQQKKQYGKGANVSRAPVRHPVYTTTSVSAPYAQMKKTYGTVKKPTYAATTAPKKAVHKETIYIRSRHETICSTRNHGERKCPFFFFFGTKNGCQRQLGE
mmetsp:Transcript_11638/g.18578  ORF Transcript_11638/g.18578 Transcript_11638/m.18578 type:complete len:650 (-) Transcript_11638:2956-4905(-)